MTDPAQHEPGTPGTGRQWPERTGDGDDLPQSVWATAQRDARAQRAGRYLPAALAHPGKMLPAIAATAITRYTRPGNLVADPMCGIGTTLIEAVHLGRDGIGVEYEPRWAAIAADGIALARRQGATGHAEVIRGDARQLPQIAPARARGRVALVVTSRRTGRASTATSAPVPAGWPSTTTATAPTRPTSPTPAPPAWPTASPRSLPGAQRCCGPAGSP
jgi:DNA methylase